MIATFDIETTKHSATYRAARLALLTHQVVHHIELTDAAGEKVEQALARLAEANARADGRAQQ
ncbi:MAG: hypothetical protein E5V62_14065 [Mesorhizobium sp.]|uniref:hypothetical protein n=1 Tax=Mesorhizobium sp. TaxID=1871066 RepID=UPI000FD2E0D3|nr:hypothetical protein [Mesorhizobium sp.]RVD69466.1 hypothetical protein EN751_25870 [Mesorhizobium sp. M4A.F.Ca.ET.029.04.2.1]TIW34861.1 MAG: hypothetical protein E5V62_14065 [Mesorhizobium sp.]